ncbi:DUF3592 domain-containing protein, partial [bacterium]|nr:DUF3592 domain-containing protein [bacterium]
MNDDLAYRLLLWLLGALFLVGPLVGFLVGRVKGLMVGVGVGCLIIGLTGLTATVRVGWERWHQLQGSASAEGVLMEFRETVAKDAQGRTTSSRDPVVRFVAADGTAHELKGLGGSQREKSPGDKVPVRYLPEAPDQALVDDFQNLWGPTSGFAAFGILPTLFGLFFVLVNRAMNGPDRTERSTQLSAQDKAVRELWSGRFVSLGTLLVIAAAILGGFYDAGNVEKTTGLTFMAIAAACIPYLIASFINPTMEWMWRGVLLILLVGFGIFGA